MASTRKLELSSGLLCAQYTSLLIIFITSITSLLPIAIGCFIQLRLYDFQQLIDAYFLTPATLFVATGFILLIIAIFGAYAVIKESCLLINLYGIFLLSVFILELSAALAAFVMKNEVREMLRTAMEQSMMDYCEDKVGFNTVVDVMQLALQCCGFDGPNDWRKYMNQTGPNMQNGIAVPISCCYGFSVDYITNSRECRDQYQIGCVERLDLTTSQTSMLIATGVATVALIQFLGAACAFMLAKALRRHKSLSATHRWQLQQDLSVLIAGKELNAPMNSPAAGYAQVESESISYTPNSPSVIN